MQGADILRDPGFQTALDRSPFQEKDLPGLSTAIADSFERMTPEQKQDLRKVLDDLDNLPAEQLRSFLRMIDFVEKNPDQYPKLVEQLVAAKAIEPGDIPDRYDPNLMAIVKTLISQALSKVLQREGASEFAKGGIVSIKKAAQKLQGQGRRGDTMLAHVNPLEAAMLKKMGGSGTINPKTGLPEFSFWDSTFGQIVKIGGQILGTVLLTPFVGPIAAGAIVGGVSSLITGGSPTDALKSALLGGLTGGLGAGVSSVLGGGGFFEGALSGGSLFGGLFGGGGAMAGAAAEGAAGQAAGGAGSAPLPPVRPTQESIDALQGANFAPPGGGATPSVPVAAAKESLTGGAGEFFSKVMTPEGIKDIWANYKIPIMLAGGAGLIGLSNAMDGKTRKPGIVKGPTGTELLAQQPGTYGFDVAKFTQQPAPVNPPVFPGGGYIAPSIAATPVPPPQYERFEYPTPYTAGIMSAKVGGHISGPGHGTSDSIPARLSDGEFVMTAKAVRGAGDGDRMKGARRMYELMHKFERMA